MHVYIQEFLIKAFIYTGTGFDYAQNSPSRARNGLERRLSS